MLRNFLATFYTNERGATMVEYGLMVALIAVIALGAVTALGVNVAATFNNIVGSL